MTNEWRLGFWCGVWLKRSFSGGPALGADVYYWAMLDTARGLRFGGGK